MATVTFDTDDLIQKMADKGIDREHAQAIVRAIVEAQDRLVTKQDLEIALAPIKTDLAVNKWMMGIMLAGVISLVMKAFF